MNFRKRNEGGIGKVANHESSECYKQGRGQKKVITEAMSMVGAIIGRNYPW